MPAKKKAKKVSKPEEEPKTKTETTLKNEVVEEVTETSAPILTSEITESTVEIVSSPLQKEDSAPTLVVVDQEVKEDISSTSMESSPVTESQETKTSEPPVEEKKEEATVPADGLSAIFSPVNETPSIVNPPEKSNLLKILWIFLAFILGIFLGGLSVYLLTFSKSKPAITKEPIKEAQNQVLPTASPTEKPVDLAKYSIIVLNGGKTQGEAGRLKKSLEGEGFKIASTGNAANSNYKETIIKTKKEVEEVFLNQLKTFLSKTYTLSDNEVLSDSEKSDIVVIIGQTLK
ncbi:MAG: LytR C-terminal domain-containing protein [Patescibacteria group bacterium]|nr:LytR C-terminal domain-containing protein [Patescibacteria group bacterium]